MLQLSIFFFRLPALVQVKYAREFQAGANLIDLGNMCNTLQQQK